ncbi:MAG: T9SS type A sorting domain-containing protein [Saprospiraceae bacterium]
MRTFLALLCILMATCLTAQRQLECAAEIDPVATMCHTDVMRLSTTNSFDYNQPLNLEWSFVSFTGNVNIDPSEIDFSAQGELSTEVINNTSSLTWPAGEYTFQLCVECRDVNGDGNHDMPCAQVTFTVTGPATTPVITELDGNQDGVIIGCNDVSFQVNSPGIDEYSSISILPDDGLVQQSISNGMVSLHRLQSVNEENCDYEVTYTISNGGCYEEATVMVTFRNPWDPNEDGIIEGFISGCPSCNRTLYLFGDRPGCGGYGTWSLESGPGDVTFSNANPSAGNVTATASEPGEYTFTYTVSNIDPCPPSTFSVSCVVLDVDSVGLGPQEKYNFCNNVLPAGSYPFSFNDIPNALYFWSIPSSTGIYVEPDHAHAGDIIVPHDVDLSQSSVVLTLNAIRYYLDDDCDGPNPPTLLELPFDNYDDNWAYIQEILSNPDVCYEICYFNTYVRFFGAPTVEVESDTINFLCSNGTETIRLFDYFSVVNNVSYGTKVTVLEQTGINPLSNVGIMQWLNLEVDECGKYVFQIDLISTLPTSGVIEKCTTTIFLTFIIESEKLVTAGTDQDHCPTDTIRLNGNNAFCEAVGTWTQVNCSPCLVTFEDPHDPNTIIHLNNSSIPDCFEFEWSFASEDESECVLTDTTLVCVDSCDSPCGTPCNLDLSVQTECYGNYITFSLIDDSTHELLDEDLYNIDWVLPPNVSGNQFTIQHNALWIPYEVIVTPKFIFEGEACCITLEGVANCREAYICNVKVLETCDSCGNVVLTLVNADTNVPIVMQVNEDEIIWDVVEGPALGYTVNQLNPITVGSKACYSFKYTHYTYPGSVPHVPMLASNICVLDAPEVCVTVDCAVDCSEFTNFFIAACGDDLADSLGLQFPHPCYEACNNSIGNTQVTFGVFSSVDNSPLDPNQYHIVWKDNTMGTYVTGQVDLVNEVTVTGIAPNCCTWTDSYTPPCECQLAPTSLYCEQPIVKYCNPDGSVSYVPGQPQIAWYGVPGATGYLVEVTYGSVSECCSSNHLGIDSFLVSNSPWVIPIGEDCFTVRIKALNSNNPRCPESAWSPTYEYCAASESCSPVIIVCGCCGGGLRDADNASLPTQLMSESEMLNYLETYQRLGYNSLEEALNSVGLSPKPSSDMSLYPNPARDEIILDLGNTGNGTYNIRIHDLLQREWRNETHEIYGRYTLQVSDLHTGLYLVTVRNLNGELMLSEKVAVVK